MRIRRMVAALGVALTLSLTACGGGTMGCGDYDDDSSSNSADVLADDCGEDD